MQHTETISKRQTDSVTILSLLVTATGLWFPLAGRMCKFCVSIIWPLTNLTLLEIGKNPAGSHSTFIILPQGLCIMAAKQKADRLNPTLSITPSKPSISSGSLFTQVNCKIFIYHWGRSNFHQKIKNSAYNVCKCIWTLLIKHRSVSYHIPFFIYF